MVIFCGRWMGFYWILLGGIFKVWWKRGRPSRRHTLDLISSYQKLRHPLSYSTDEIRSCNQRYHSRSRQREWSGRTGKFVGICEYDTRRHPSWCSRGPIEFLRLSSRRNTRDLDESFGDPSDRLFIPRDPYHWKYKSRVTVWEIDLQNRSSKWESILNKEVDTLPDCDRDVHNILNL